MNIAVGIPFQSHIQVENEMIVAVGPKELLLKVNQLKKQHGMVIETWPLFLQAQLPEEILINEFINKAKQEIFVYNHEELCHCRMVKTETVKNAVKAGCRKVSDVSRTTLAGTGCGSCRSDIEAVIKALTA